jgi:hypothetical protein
LIFIGASIRIEALKENPKARNPSVGAKLDCPHDPDSWHNIPAKIIECDKWIIDVL